MNNIKWHIDIDTLNKMRGLRHKQRAFGPMNENKAWGIRAYKYASFDQNGTYETRGEIDGIRNEYIRFQLCCFTYPKDIHEISIRYKIEYKFGDFEDPEIGSGVFEEFCILNDNNTWNLWTRESPGIELRDLDGIESLDVNVEIEIVKLFKITGIKIESEHFDKYDIS